MPINMVSPGNSTPTSRRDSIMRILKGVVVSMVISIIILAITALIMLFSPLSDRYLRTIAIIVSIIGLIFGGSSAAKSYTGKGWMIGGLVGIVYILALYILGMITITGFVMNTALFIMLGVGFVSGAVGGIIGTNRRSGKRRR